MGIIKPEAKIIRLDELEKGICRYYIFLEPEMPVTKRLVEGLNRFKSKQIEGAEKYFSFYSLDKQGLPIPQYELDVSTVNDQHHISFIQDEFGFRTKSEITYYAGGSKKLWQKGREDVSAILQACDKENIAAVVRFDGPATVLATKKARDMIKWY